MLSQEDVGEVSAAGDSFGAAVATADLNSDGCGDLAIGIPGDGAGAGAVVVLWGSPEGLDTTAPQVLRQGTAPLTGALEAGDRFGTTLAPAGSLATGGAAGLWIGAPGEDVGSVKDAGMVTLVKATTGGMLGAGGVQNVHQDSAGVPGAAEAGDRFGERLSGGARTLLVGVPQEDVGKAKDAGIVLALTAEQRHLALLRPELCRHPWHRRDGGPVRRSGRPRGRLRVGHGRDLGDRCAVRGPRRHIQRGHGHAA